MNYEPQFRFMIRIPALLIIPFLFIAIVSSGQADNPLEPLDVFEIENISDPQISPDGQQVVYVRNARSIMKDQTTSNLWIIDYDGENHLPLTVGSDRNSSPRWSPDGKQLIYLSNRDGATQLYRRWMDNGRESLVADLRGTPSNLSWSPDGQWVAFSMFVPQRDPGLVKLPKKPVGARWADQPKYIDELRYRADGRGYLKDGYTQLFVLSIDGGYPRQLTDEPYNHSSNLEWTSDGKSIIFSANRRPAGEYEPANTEVYELEVKTGDIDTLTDRKGPDRSPKISPDGKTIAYLGYDDQYLGYQISSIYLMDRDGSNPRLLSGNLDRQANNIQWAKDNHGLYFQYDDQGNTKIAHIALDGQITDIVNNVGGLSLGRPYGGGTFSSSKSGRFAFTHSTPDHPADLAVTDQSGKAVNRLTNLNRALFEYKQLGAVEEIRYKSSFDNREIQGWICKPPGFDPNKKYPLLLEIHGGPFANYGWRFSAEVQLYAASGYVVLYTNPRGSSSYGKEFGNLIHHNYPGQDYDDLISGVDAVIEKGYIDESQLYVTGGSGGGVLTAWIVGNTDRFRAAVVAKPVINWSSFVLHADNPAFFAKYWFPGYPWEYPDHYWKRSPLSLVGNVKTPTMLLTGEQDYRTPMSETEQYYAALKLNKVETAMVRIQESGHGIANKPSNLISKVAYILGWFEKYRESVTR